MRNTIESIYRYPIKGLSGESLESVTLTAGCVIPGDREYAFARAGVLFDPDSPKHMKKTNFLALVREEKLAALDTKFNNASKMLSLSKLGKLLIEVNLTSSEDCQRIAKFLQLYLGLPLVRQPHVVRATDGTKDHSFSDVPDKAISFINLTSIEEFSKNIGVNINPMRFRGNILFKNSQPWQENNWLNKKIKIGEAVVKIHKRTKRCAATNVNPLSAARDINIPKELNKLYHHMDFGVYAVVIKTGLVAIGDKIELLKET